MFIIICNLKQDLPFSYKSWRHLVAKDASSLLYLNQRFSKRRILLHSHLCKRYPICFLPVWTRFNLYKEVSNFLSFYIFHHCHPIVYALISILYSLLFFFLNTVFFCICIYLCNFLLQFHHWFLNYRKKY